MSPDARGRPHPRRPARRCTASSSPSACRARATSPCSTRCTTRPIRYVICRHEVGAANMADAYGKLTGRPGICMVTRGPGATHASCGVHTAHQDSTPLILLIGQVGRDMSGREAFQEIDYRADVRPDGEVGRADRPRRADPRDASPGPSTSRLPAGRARSCSRCPRTCSSSASDVADAAPYAATQAHPGDDDLQRLRDLLQAARRPLVDRRRRAVDGAGARRPDGVVRGERACRWRRRGAARTTSTTRRRCYVGHVGARPRPAPRRARARRRRAARRRRPAGRDHDVRATRCSTCRARVRR